MFQKHKVLLPVFIVVGIVGLITLAAWLLAPHYDDIYALVPGFYDKDTYNSLREEKNDSIDENSDLLIQVSELEVSLQEVELTSEGYAEIVEINNEIISTQETILGNLEKIVSVDEELLDMRLPDVVFQYIKTSHELDQIRRDLMQMAIEISHARRDLAELNKMRIDFDNCLASVDWAGQDKNISDAVIVCTEKIPQMIETVEVMKGWYEVELVQLTAYLNLLKEEWEANAAYYLAISQNDYAKANEHDLVFVDRKRQISEMNVMAAFGEFYDEAILVMLGEFDQMKEDELEKEKQADEWYERNIQR